MVMAQGLLISLRSAEIGQNGGGCGESAGREFDLQMRDDIRGIGVDAAVAQPGLDHFGNRILAAVVEAGGQLE